MWILSAILMVLGGSIYVLWRPSSLVMFGWFSAIGLGQPVEVLRQWVAPFAVHLPSWVYYSLPQALWLLSGCVAIHAIWKDWHLVSAQTWALIVLAIASGGEIGQALHVVPGVYDPTDLVLLVAAFVTYETVAIAYGTRKLTQGECCE